MRAALVVLFVLVAARALPQSVSATDGNIVFIDQNGTRRLLTSSHLDSEPSLSVDGSHVVFVRRTPGHPIDTGIGSVDDNELWTVPVDRPQELRRVLAGHSGGYNQEKNLVLAGFAVPQSSQDGTKVYFISTTWVTSAAIHVLNPSTGQTKLLYAGLDVEVIREGSYKGFLIGTKDPSTADRGRIVEYWLLDPDGREVRRIGETKADLARFKTSIKQR